MQSSGNRGGDEFYTPIPSAEFDGAAARQKKNEIAPHLQSLSRQATPPRSRAEPGDLLLDEQRPWSI